LGQAAVIPSLQLVRDLRLAGIGALLAFGGRSLKAQLKAADKAGVAYTLILGDAELAQGVVIARDMTNSQQTTVPSSDVIAWLQSRV
jgi:histidyl-tRNA synthetase